MVVVGILAAGFSLVSVVAISRAGKDGARDFFRILHLLTVMFVIGSATVLAMLGILGSQGTTGVLGGYELGGLIDSHLLRSRKPPHRRPLLKGESHKWKWLVRRSQCGFDTETGKESGLSALINKFFYVMEVRCLVLS